MANTVTTKTPPVKETVGALYFCFATVSETDPSVYTGEYDTSITKTEVAKTVNRTENGGNTPVYASGKTYVNKNKTSSIDHSISVVAFDAEDLAKMRGEVVDSTTGLVMTLEDNVRPFLAFGKVVKLADGYERYEWYPKCQLTENTDDNATSEESYSEQDDTLTIRALPFDDAGHIRTYIDTSIANPNGVTEATFFAQVIKSASDVPAKA